MQLTMHEMPNQLGPHIEIYVYSTGRNIAYFETQKFIEHNFVLEKITYCFFKQNLFSICTRICTLRTNFRFF